MISSSVNSKYSIPGIRSIILVSSCKGGVGKSTVSVLLARNIRDDGYRVGIVDADIHGPSLPTMLNITGNIEINENRKFIPLIDDGIKVMSIGFLIDNDSAIAWRNLMAIKAMNQLICDTEWGELDYLIVDMPPGTGDLHISMIQKYNISGAVIVTMPDNVSTSDVIKVIDLYKKMHVPVYGIVENMSYFVDSSGEKRYLFGCGGGIMLSRKCMVRQLCSIPIIEDILRCKNVPNIWKEIY
jgi:ATP-binding protein involved in chromosome partitioning